MGGDQDLPPVHDPDWAKRVAAIEKEFRKAERRRRTSNPRTARVRLPRRFRTAYAWAIVVIAALTFAVVVHPWRHATGQVPVANAPQPISTGTGSDPFATSTPEVTAGRTENNGGNDDPFAGSPAQAWPSADKGVIMPAAAKVGPYSAAQVSASLALAHRYILLTRADPRVLVNHQTQLLTALVSSDELADSDNKNSGPDSFLRPTLLAPGNTLSAPIRVNGTVNATYHQDGQGHALLQVKTNLVWAYPLASQTGRTASGTDIAVLHDQMTLDLNPFIRPPDNKVFIESTREYLSNIDCEYAGKGLLGLPRDDDPSTLPSASGTLPTGNQAYDPHTPLDLGRTCK